MYRCYEFYPSFSTNTKVSYASFVCEHRPLKSEQMRVRLVVGGNKLTCPYDTGSSAVNSFDIKLLLNSVISDSDKGARLLTLDLKDHFLASPMQTPEYMKIPQKYVPSDIINKYNLQSKFHNGYRNQQRHVWTQTSNSLCIKLPSQKFTTIWILSYTSCNWNMKI